jgi:hypothetical protein
MNPLLDDWCLYRRTANALLFGLARADALAALGRGESTLSCERGRQISEENGGRPYPLGFRSSAVSLPPLDFQGDTVGVLRRAPVAWLMPRLGRPENLNRLIIHDVRKLN